MTDELEKFRSHSVLLNSVVWRLGRALGTIPEGVTRIDNINIDEIVDRTEEVIWSWRQLTEAQPVTNPVTDAPLTNEDFTAS